MAEFMGVATINDDSILTSLSYLPDACLAATTAVCQRWNAVGSSDELWAAAVSRRFALPLDEPAVAPAEGGGADAGDHEYSGNPSWPITDERGVFSLAPDWAAMPRVPGATLQQCTRCARPRLGQQQKPLPPPRLPPLTATTPHPHPSCQLPPGLRPVGLLGEVGLSSCTQSSGAIAGRPSMGYRAAARTADQAGTSAHEGLPDVGQA